MYSTYWRESRKTKAKQINPNNTNFDAKGLIERKYMNHWPFKVGNHGGITILEIEYKLDQNRVVGISIVNVQDKVDQQL